MSWTIGYQSHNVCTITQDYVVGLVTEITPLASTGTRFTSFLRATLVIVISCFIINHYFSKEFWRCARIYLWRYSQAVTLQILSQIAKDKVH